MFSSATTDWKTARTRRTLATALAVVALLTSVTSASAQATVDTADAPPVRELAARGVVINMGAGPGNGGGGAILGLSVPAGPGELVLRFAGTGEVSMQLFNQSPREESFDVAAMYGFRPSVGSRGWFRVAAGLGSVQTQRWGEITQCVFIFCEREYSESRSLGVALQADAMWAIWKRFGLGTSVFANLNGDRNIIGVGITLATGRVR